MSWRGLLSASQPDASILIRRAGLAQLVERLTCNHEVASSILAPGSKISRFALERHRPRGGDADDLSAAYDRWQQDGDHHAEGSEPTTVSRRYPTVTSLREHLDRRMVERPLLGWRGSSPATCSSTSRASAPAATPHEDVRCGDRTRRRPQDPAARHATRSCPQAGVIVCRVCDRAVCRTDVVGQRASWNVG